MHHYAESRHLDPCHVNTIATQLAADKAEATKKGESLPAFSKNYFEESIEHLNVWKNNIHGQQIINHLKAFFA
jgi:hypothetical protein